MSIYSKYFKCFENNIWLNAASEGPLPLVSKEALDQVVDWKSSPFKLDIPKFIKVPLELKKTIGKLLNVESSDVILGNSASYGLHLLANGIKWKQGDQILLMQNDFPTNILPWLALEKQGVEIVQIPVQNHILTAQELEKYISKKTRLVCLSHVHTFSGLILDVDLIGEICKRNKSTFVLNISQSAGTMSIDVSEMSVDAIVCAGYKWLCGPYGTGFCWMTSSLREGLDLNQAYWIASLSESELQSEDIIKYKEQSNAQKYDVFGTSNFFNFVPFRASIDLFLDVGIENVFLYHQELIDVFLKGLDFSKYEVVSSKSKESRSSLVVFKHKVKTCKQIYEQLLNKNIYLALWKEKLRLAPHIYNTQQEIEKVLKILNQI
jgi:cysteine desulfurase/selenocysteine lyase